MAVSNRLQVVHFHCGKEIYKLNVPQELSKKLLEDKEFAISYLRQMVKQQQQGSSSGSVSKGVIESSSSAPSSSKKKAGGGGKGQISLLHIPITISSDGASIAHHQWPVEAAKVLLQEYKSKIDDFNGGVRKKKDIWTDIHQIMRSYGYAFSQENCEKKFRNMKSSYLAIRERNMKLGRNTSKWEFYDEMEEIFGDSLSAAVESGAGAGEKSSSVITVLADSDSAAQMVMSDDEAVATTPAAVMTEASSSLLHLDTPDPDEMMMLTPKHNQTEPPAWFASFLKEFQQVEEKKLEELKRIHQDNVQLLRQRNELLEKLNHTIDKLIQS